MTTGASSLERTLEALLATPLPELVARPWFDRFALWSILRWYVPLSRLWATAAVARGDVDAFAADADLAPLRGPRRSLAAILLRDLDVAASAADSAERRWLEGLFGTRRLAAADVAALETERRHCSHAYMAQRLRFIPLLPAADPPKVRWAVPSPDSATETWRHVLANPAAAFASFPSDPAIAQSPPHPVRGGRAWWLRFASPAAHLADTVTARVVEPSDRARLTIIAGHGLLVDSELWRTSFGLAEVLLGHGCRVVEPTSPWHGRRTPPGSYGGEPFIATAPAGPLALFLAQVAETAALVRWCRATFGGPVAVAGISLTSFVAQLVASHCGPWPADAWPDGVLLMVHHQRPAELAWRSRLAIGLGADRALEAAGWTPARLEPWNRSAAATPRPVIAPERIVSVLGQADTVTPFEGGAALAESWRLPAANRFVSPGGHFSTPIGALGNGVALRRFIEVATGRP